MFGLDINDLGFPIETNSRRVTIYIKCSLPGDVLFLAIDGRALSKEAFGSRAASVMMDFAVLVVSHVCRQAHMRETFSRYGCLVKFHKPVTVRFRQWRGRSSDPP